MSASIPLGMDWIQILFVTYISAGAGVGVRTFSQLHGQGSAGAGFGGVVEMHDPAHLGYIYRTLVLVISLMLIVTLNRAAERDKFRTSISSPKRLECYE